MSVCGAEYEPRSNKNVVMRMRDAIVVAGYSGIAYFGDMPTDKWIAETAWGASLGSGWSLADLPAPWLWEATDRLRIGLQAELTRRRLTSHSHQIVITGIRRDRNSRGQHVQWLVTHHRNDPGAVAVQRLDRRNLPSSQFTCKWIGQADPNAIARMRARLKMEGDKSADAFESVLIDTVKETGDIYTGTVGKDVMSIRISTNAGRPNVIITYVSESSGSLQPSHESHDAAYSPWILAPGFSFSPTVTSGSNSQSGTVGDLDYTIRNAHAGPDVSSHMSSTAFARRPAPGYKRSIASGHAGPWRFPALDERCRAIAATLDLK